MCACGCAFVLRANVVVNIGSFNIWGVREFIFECWVFFRLDDVKNLF